MNFSDTDIAALARKYAEIRALRASPLTKEVAEPRMRALAKEFPGALRELQGLPMVAIESRQEELARVMQGAAPLPDWARIHMAHHRILRCVLTAKRWFASLGTERAYADPSTFETLAGFEHDPETAGIVARALDCLRTEPRASRVALQLVAETLGHEPAVVRAALWRDTLHETTRAAKAH